jgi:hypothetical protein
MSEPRFWIFVDESLLWRVRDRGQLWTETFQSDVKAYEEIRRRHPELPEQDVQKDTATRK